MCYCRITRLVLLHNEYFQIIIHISICFTLPELNIYMYVIVYIDAIWLILTKLKKETFNHRLLIKKLHLLVFELNLARILHWTLAT